jgi:uncharacterized phage protein (TIGR01671 family)
MNDRFKFRVWDKKNKKMIRNNYSLEIEGDSSWKISYGDVFDNIGFCKKVDSLLFRDGILMQSTGLKDKNGKLIYEGDILHKVSQKGEGYMCGDGVDIYHTIVFSKVSITNECFEDYIGFWAVHLRAFIEKDFEEDAISIRYLTDKESCNPSVVIGNIYENPELLTKKDLK